jgi:tripartite ATP-independent transporter DctM subunit
LIPIEKQTIKVLAVDESIKTLEPERVKEVAQVPPSGGSPGRGVSALAVRCLEATAILMMALEVAIVLAGVFFRYVLNRPIAGSDEIAGLILVWMTFIGGAVAQRRRSHPSVSIVVQRLSPAVIAYLDAITRLVEVIFFVSVCWYSMQLSQLRFGEPSAGAGFDMGLYPVGLVLGATISLLFSVGQLAAVPRRPLGTVVAVTVALAAACWAAMHAGIFDPGRISSTTLLLTGFSLLLLMNAPLAVALGFPAMLYLLILGARNPIMLPQRLIAGADNFVLLAIPLFILAGAMMETGGISRRLVDLATALVGHLRGGLAHVTVVAEILFSGISGSTTADVAAMGALLIPSMEKAGYRKEEAICIVSAASAMGILVPPCLLMVILATIADISVTALFLAGFLPAAVLAGALMLLIYVKARRQQWQVAARASWRNLRNATLHAMVPLLLPVIIFGSIFTGAATVTESAVLAVIYALVVGVLVYRELPLRRLPHLFLESTSLSAMSMWLIASASVFTWLLARDQVPQMVSGVILSLSGARWFFLVASVLLFIFFAALLEGFPAVIILGPIFYPIAEKMGVSTLHFSIIIVACVGIGLLLPPVGVGLFVACGIARSTIGRVIRPFAPYLLVLLLGLLIVTFIPWITIVLPHHFLTLK